MGLTCDSEKGQFQLQAVTGGDIHQSFRLTDTTNGRDYFVKTNRAEHANLFIAEQESLAEIAATETLLTPQVLLQGVAGDTAYLVLSFLSLKDRGYEAALGNLLARMHRYRGCDSYGFYHDNYIGMTPQLNARCDSWADFWINQRIAPQMTRARQQGLNTDIDRLLAAISDLLSSHHPQPSLLHGDLWGGNKGFINHGTPVVFDPACYYGDRETDIAFTRLFGGFSADFYTAYHNEWPLPKGFNSREGVYNLYHLLNHLNLFGSGYLAACQREIDTILLSA
ncbi:MAG TPA: fructosamine kinase family protein [Cellvibrionaceae bacterium]